MKKVLYFDCETTGLDPVKNDIIQLAGCIEINGKVEDEFEYKMQPFSYDNISQEALDTHGFGIDDIKTFESPKTAYASFVRMLGKHVNKFERSDKFYPAGYNVEFDLNFLGSFFKKNNDVYLGSWINWRKIDPLPVLYMHDFLGMKSLPNYKLGTVCEALGIEIKAHDALSDIRATRQLVQMVLSEIKKEEIVPALV